MAIKNVGYFIPKLLHGIEVAYVRLVEINPEVIESLKNLEA